jgi:murein DD-endopeptidase MepM/ murein hydrolase activator NlpD
VRFEMGGAMRRIAYSLAAVCALAGCATTNTVYSRPAPSAAYEPPPPGPNMYSTAPRAPVHSELFACGNWGSNLGEIGYRGEAARYTPYMETPAGSLLRYPAEQACLSSGFGWRGAATGGGRQHNGLDLANPNGGYIYAAADGRIVSADWRGGYGNFIEIDHGRGVSTRYAHLAEIDPNLRPGMRISAGTPMGRMGMTGNATGVHLHYEVQVDGLLVDPLHYGMPQPYVTTPVTQSYPEPLPLPAQEAAPYEAAPEQAPASEAYPEPVRLRPPSEQ